MTRKTILALALLPTLAGLLNCTGNGPGPSGSLSVPLSAIGSQGTQYWLVGEFLVAGPETIALTTDYLSDEPVLVVNPRVGSYQVYLCDGTNGCGVGTWSIATRDCVDTGTGAIVDRGPCDMGATGYAWNSNPVAGAELASTNPQGAIITQGGVSEVRFQFYVPGEGMIVFARGTLNIAADIGQGFPEGHACTLEAAQECASHVCDATTLTCAAPTCTDGVLNGDEAGPDCGGSCPTACPIAGECTTDAECTPDTFCNLMTSTCEPAQCAGDAECPLGEYCELQTRTCFPLDAGQCGSDADCPFGAFCDPSTRICTPLDASSCSDGIQNGDEAGVDCGGSCPTPCLNLCGNGIVDPGEQCDGADLGGNTCDTVVGASEPGSLLTCAADCSLDVSACFPSTCGDAFCDETTESSLSCPLDCFCGDLVCDRDELASGSCLLDCGF